MRNEKSHISLVAIGHANSGACKTVDMNVSLNAYIIWDNAS